MGYEITMLLGKSHHQRELDDGIVEVWFELNASLDLCSLGYQDDALSRLISDSFAEAKRHGKKVHYCFGHFDGNTAIKKDRYESPMWPVPIAKVVEAISQLPESAMEYRRLRWAKALLVEMASDPEQLEVMFYGH